MHSPRPTVVLVHDGCSDATTWFGVTAELHRRGLTVLAVANPLRGLAHDAAYLADVLGGIGGPVVLVGHSYGGAVITEAGVGPDVLALVYVAAYLPEVGESHDVLAGRFAPSPLIPRLRRTEFTTGGTDRATELTVPAECFRPLVAADLDEEVAQVLASLQRPAAERVLTDAPTVAAWRTRPSWALVAGADQALSPAGQRFTAERAGATVLDLPDASHAVAVSRPTVVAELVHEAVRAVSARPRRPSAGRAAAAGRG